MREIKKSSKPDLPLVFLKWLVTVLSVVMILGFLFLVTILGIKISNFNTTPQNLSELPNREILIPNGIIETIDIEKLNFDKQLLDKINKFAPIKHILKNKPKNDNQVIELLDDISKDLFNHDLELRIQELESKFSEDLSEKTFNELKELKNERKVN